MLAEKRGFLSVHFSNRNQPTSAQTVFRASTGREEIGNAWLVTQMEYWRGIQTSPRREPGVSLRHVQNATETTTALAGVTGDVRLHVSSEARTTVTLTTLLLTTLLLLTFFLLCHFAITPFSAQEELLRSTMNLSAQIDQHKDG
jgi:hypothetical protein